MTDSLIVYANTGDLRMIVHDAANATDPAWHPAGCVTVSMPRASYDLCPDQLTLMQSTQALVAAANPLVGAALQGKIDAILAAIAAAAALAASDIPDAGPGSP